MDIYILYSVTYGHYREAFKTWDRLEVVRERLNATLGGNYTSHSYYPIPLALSDKEI